MTKFFQKLCFFSLILASGLLFRVTTIAASGNYTITNYDVTANIQKDGSADISQAVTYTFKNGQTNAVYLNQPIMDGATTTIPSVVVQQDGKSYQLSQRDDGSNDTYSVINNENGLRIKSIIKFLMPLPLFTILTTSPKALLTTQIPLL